MNYYNENDLKAAAWLGELIKERLIPNGKVDTRSIADVAPSDLDGFTQCHFFAGIGGWSYALELAGWPTDRPVWTGSCPCQPFSNAGKRKGAGDARHLWPEFARLISERTPPIIFGEQVASPAGREWLAGVFADLEAMDYRRAGADLCAASVGAPHIRQRLYWMAHAKNTNGRPGECEAKTGVRSNGIGRRGFAGGGASGGMGKSEGDRDRPASNGRSLAKGEAERWQCERGGPSSPDRLGDTHNPRPQGRNGEVMPECAGECTSRPRSAWDYYELAPCRDGKSRRFEPGSFPLAHGIPHRVGLLRGYGNAIVPQVAAEFIQAATEAMI